MIIDGTNLILGRLCSFAAKKALLGEKVDIVNCEKVVITGRRRFIIEDYLHKKNKGLHSKGPFHYKQPHFFVRRTVRGMLPHKKEKGRIAFRRVMCHIGMPDEFKNEKLLTVKDADVSKVPNLKFITVGEVCREMGAKQ